MFKKNKIQKEKLAKLSKICRALNFLDQARSKKYWFIVRTCRKMGVAVSTDQCGGGKYKGISGTDAPGNDLRNAGTSDVCQLVKLCDADPRCRGFNSNGWLKSSVGGKVSQQNVDLYEKTAPPPPPPSNFAGEYAIMSAVMQRPEAGKTDTQNVVGQKVIVNDRGAFLDISAKEMQLPGMQWIRSRIFNVLKRTDKLIYAQQNTSNVYESSIFESQDGGMTATYTIVGTENGKPFEVTYTLSNTDCNKACQGQPQAALCALTCVGNTAYIPAAAKNPPFETTDTTPATPAAFVGRGSKAVWPLVILGTLLIAGGGYYIYRRRQKKE